MAFDQKAKSSTRPCQDGKRGQSLYVSDFAFALVFLPSAPIVVAGFLGWISLQIADSLRVLRIILGSDCKRIESGTFFQPLLNRNGL
jgi:hypothetical protein